MFSALPMVEERRVQTQADHLLLMEGIIKNQFKSIHDLQIELKDKRAMYRDGYETSVTYHEHDELVKEESKKRASVKSELNKQPGQIALAQEIKDLAFDLREKKKTLSPLLLDYKEQSHAQQLELFDGGTYEIVEEAKLKKV
jgi:hypothetical protein